MGPQVESTTSPQPVGGESQGSQQEEGVHEVKRYRDPPGDRGILGNPFGEDDRGADQRLTNDGDARQHGAEPGWTAFGGSSPHPSQQNEDEDESYPADGPMGELHGRRTLELGHHLAFACRPGGTAPCATPRSPHDGPDEYHADVEDENEPGVAGQACHPGVKVRNAWELRVRMCQDRVMQRGSAIVLASDASAYWFAGILTLAAALIVVVVMMAASSNDNGESS